jgi:hypothetical protein
MTINSQPFFSAVQFGPSGPPLLLTTNVGSSYALGGDIGLRSQSPAGIRWGASYALVSTTNHTTLNQAALPTSAIDYAASVPRSVVDGNLGTHEVASKWIFRRGGIELPRLPRYGTSIYLEPIEVRNYLMMNRRAGYNLTDSVTLSLTGQRFTTSRLYQTAAPPVERQLIVSLTARF